MSTPDSLAPRYELVEATDRHGRHGPFLVHVDRAGIRTWVAQFYTRGDAAEPGDILPSQHEARAHAARVLEALST